MNKDVKSNNIYSLRNQITNRKDKNWKIKRAKSRVIDVVIIVFIIMVISLINIYSARYYNSGMKYSDFKKHGIYLLISIGFFVSSMKINYYKYNKKKVIMLFLILILTVFPGMAVLADKVPSIVPRINGATGWIRVFGFGFQPSEVFKCIFVIMMSYRFNLSEKKNHKTAEIILKNAIIPVIFAWGLLLQNDLGTAIHYFAIYLFMLFMTKVSGKFIAWLSGGFGIAGIIGMGYFYFKDFSESGYMAQRIKSFLVGLISNEYDSDKGYQVKQSLIGIGSGGFSGKGYGNGIQKYSYLPEIHTDFIFTNFAEEIGFIGVLLLTILMVGLYNKIKQTAIDCDDYFGKYLATGIAGYIFIQFLINVSVAIGLLPVFGIPMPLMSFGGSSLIGIFWSLGIIININTTNREKLRQSINQEES